MVTLFNILVFLAIYHFFYEGVIAPSLRHGLRYQFFSLRDELRNLDIQGLSKNDQVIFTQLDTAICDIIKSMSFISLANYYLLKKKFSSDVKTKSEVEKRRSLIENTENSKLKEIDQKIGSLGSKALFINNGGWAIYLLVPIIVLLFVAVIFTHIDRLRKEIVKMSFRLIYSHDEVEGPHLGLV